MNRATHILIALLITQLTPCHAMDVEPKKEQITQTSPLLQMPPEVLEHILTFVIENDPDALGNLAKIQEVCKGLAGFLSKDEMKWLLGLDEHGVYTYLLAALEKLDTKKVQLLANLGLPQNFKNGIIFRAIFNAGRSDQKDYYQRLLQIISILEKAGATWKGDIWDNPENTLERVVLLAKLPLIRLLLDHGAKPTATSLDFALTHANRTNYPDIPALLLKYGATPTRNQVKNIINLNYDPQLLKLLVTYGADVTSADENGNTPLDLASSADEFMNLKFAKSPKIAKILIDAGAVPSAKNLKSAVLRNNTELVTLFITHGADVNATGGRFLTHPPLSYVRSAKMARILLEAGAELFIKCQGQTPFQSLVQEAKESKNPMILIEVLKTRYRYETALAIATAIMAGAPYISAVCNIL